MQDITQHLWIGFAGGLLAFAHCLGMCGGFVVHLSQERNRQRMVAAQLLWQAGKLLSYTFLGALAGYAGASWQLLFQDNARLQNLLSYAAGALILLMGLSLLGLMPVRARRTGGAGSGTLAALGRQLFASSTPGAALYLGMATGFLPCPIVLAFLAYSLQSGSVAQGMATMGALSLGTMFPLLLLGGLTRLTGLHLRSWAPKAGGIILVLLGLCTALRGTTAFHQLLGCPAKPSPQKAEANESKPCCTGKSNGNGSGI